jgi:hypothetical protein
VSGAAAPGSLLPKRLAYIACRSASAAKEIKDLIDDPVEKVNAVSKLVGQAGLTMDEIGLGTSGIAPCASQAFIFPSRFLLPQGINGIEHQQHQILKQRGAAPVHCWIDVALGRMRPVERPASKSIARELTGRMAEQIPPRR